MNIKLAALTLAALSVALTACGSEATSNGAVSSDVTSAKQNWQKVMQCDGAVVDVDVNERRDFQIVVNDSRKFAQLDRLPFGEIKNDLERIYRGRAIDGKGVFASESFSGFFANEVNSHADGTRPGYVVRSVNANGSATVHFAAVNLATCGGQLRDNNLDKACPVVGDISFSSCTLVNLP